MKHISVKKRRLIAAIVAILILVAMVVSSISVLVYAAESTSANEAAEDTESTGINEDMAATIASELMNNYGVDKEDAILVGQSIVTDYADAKGISITGVSNDDYQVVVDFKADGKETSITYDKPQESEIVEPQAQTAPVPNEVGFFVGGEVINTMNGPITLQTSGLPVGYTDAGGQATINEHAEQYRAWAITKGDYIDTVVLCASDQLDALKREPLAYALEQMFIQYASEKSGQPIADAEEAKQYTGGALDVLNTLFRTEESGASYSLSDADGNYYPMAHYVTYLDLAPINEGIEPITACDSYVAPYGSGYVGYVMEHGQKSPEAEDQSRDPVAMISTLLENPEYTDMDKDKIMADLKGKLEDADIASLTKQAAALKDYDAEPNAGKFIQCLMIGEAKYQHADVGNVMDKDIYYHTVGEGGGIATPASYEEDTAPIDPDFQEYEIEDNTDEETKMGLDMFKNFAKIYTVILIISLLLCLIVLAATWRIFEKAGEKGWKVLIPIFNMYTMSMIATGGWIWFILLFVPFINLAASIMISVKLANAFGKGTGFGLGLCFIPIVFYPMLAYSDAEYDGPYREAYAGDGFDMDVPKKGRKKGKSDAEDDLEEFDDEF